MPFRFTRLEIPEVIVVEPTTFGDGRGFFRETYKRSEFVRGGIDRQFVQENHSRSSRGVLRGLHFQVSPAEQGKLVSVTRGEVWDVSADIRPGSPTYGRWVGVNLTEENGRMVFVPEGFAHGFVTLSDVADVVYRVTAEYAPEMERGIRWDDPDLAIEWPTADPSLSAKDQAYPFLRDFGNNSEVGQVQPQGQYEEARR